MHDHNEIICTVQVDKRDHDAFKIEAARRMMSMKALFHEIVADLGEKK